MCLLYLITTAIYTVIRIRSVSLTISRSIHLSLKTIECYRAVVLENKVCFGSQMAVFNNNTKKTVILGVRSAPKVRWQCLIMIT